MAEKMQRKVRIHTPGIDRFIPRVHTEWCKKHGEVIPVEMGTYAYCPQCGVWGEPTKDIRGFNR